MSHPQSCRNPEGCHLSYVEHLRGFVIGVDALPTRAVHRSPGQRDEPAWRTAARERRWAKDMPAFKSLIEQGYDPPRIDGSDRLAATAKTDADINGAPR
jgi:hypothetical protein